MSKELKRTVKPIINIACGIDNDGKDEYIVTVQPTTEQHISALTAAE